jgi:uncharacterized OsmC-like protein
MDDEYQVTSVRSYSSGTVGRSLNTAGRHHFVVDSPSLGEALTSSDVFLAGISSCGVNLVEGAARDSNVPLTHIEVTIDGKRKSDTPMNFARVEMRFTLTGPTQEQAEALIQRYKDL